MNPAADQRHVQAAFDKYVADHDLRTPLSNAITTAFAAGATDPIKFFAAHFTELSTGQVAPAKEFTAVEPTAAPAGAAVQGWTAEGWVGALHAVEPIVAKALVGGATDELAALRALGASVDTESLGRRLGEANINGALAAALLPRLQALAAPAAAAGNDAGLQAKFAEGAAFDLKYGDLSTFFSGVQYRRSNLSASC